MKPRSPFSHLSAAMPKVQVTEAPKPAPTAGQIAFQGNIAAIALENIFQLFDLAALTGRLEVQSTENTGNFYFTKGVLTYGMLQIQPRKIGEILLEAKMITPTQLQDCLRLHAQGRFQQRFGQILLEQGYVLPDSLDSSLSRQIKEAFFATLSWQEGTFAYFPDQFPSPKAIHLQARVDHLLLEGMLSIDNTADDQV